MRKCVGRWYSPFLKRLGKMKVRMVIRYSSLSYGGMKPVVNRLRLENGFIPPKSKHLKFFKRGLTKQNTCAIIATVKVAKQSQI